ncbi:hypothetical protein D3C87_1784720 [compost metagenome]
MRPHGPFILCGVEGLVFRSGQHQVGLAESRQVGMQVARRIAGVEAVAVSGRCRMPYGSAKDSRGKGEADHRQMIEPVDSKPVEHGEADDAPDGRPGPAARAGPGCWSVMTKERCQEHKAIDQPAMLPAREPKGQPTT